MWGVISSSDDTYSGWIGKSTNPSPGTYIRAYFLFSLINCFCLFFIQIRLLRLEQEEGPLRNETQQDKTDKTEDLTNLEMEPGASKKAKKAKRNLGAGQKSGSRQPQTCTVCNAVLSSRGALTKHMIIHQVFLFGNVWLLNTVYPSFITITLPILRIKSLFNAKSAARVSIKQEIWKHTQCRGTAVWDLIFVVFVERGLCTNPILWNTWATILVNANSNVTTVATGFKHNLLW